MAARYWVGGTGTWRATDTSHWSDSDGGPSGASVPTVNDDVFFTANSGSSSTVVTLDGPRHYSKNVDCTGFVGTLRNGFLWEVTGSLFKFSSSMVIDSTFYPTISFTAASGTTQLFFAQKPLNDINFYGGATYSAEDGINCTSNNDISINGSCTLVLNSSIVECRYFYIYSGSANLGSSTISCMEFAYDNQNTVSLIAGTSTIQSNDYRFRVGLWRGGQTGTFTASLNNVVSSSREITISNVNITNLTLTTGELTAEWSVSCIVTGALTLTGVYNGRPLVKNSSITSTGTRNIQYVDFQNSSVSGGTLSGTDLGDCGGNTNITTRTPVTRYAKNAGSWYETNTWSITDGGSAGASYPLPQDTAFFTASSGTGSYDLAYRIGSLKCTAFTQTLRTAFGLNKFYVYKDFELSSSTILSNSSLIQIYFTGTGSYNVNAFGKITTSTSVEVSNGPYTLTGNLTCSTLSVAGGTLNFGANTISCKRFYATTSTVNLNSSNVTVTDDVWSFSPECVLNAGTSTLNLNGGTTFDVNFSGGGKTYNTVNFARSTGTTSVATRISGANTFSTLSLSSSNVNAKYEFQSGATQTISSMFSARGTAEIPLVITSQSTSNHTLNYTGGSLISCEYMNISYSTATPSNKWYAGKYSTSGTSVSGWIFDNPPQQGSLFFGSNF